MAGEIRTRESAIWGWLKAAADKMGSHAHLHRIENEVETGDPDVEGCLDGGAFCCELKVAEGFRRDGTFKIKMSVHQGYFAYRRVRAGGRSWVLIRVEDEHYLVDGGWALDLFEQKDRLCRVSLGRVSVVDPKAKAEKVIRVMAGKI